MLNSIGIVFTQLLHPAKGVDNRKCLMDIVPLFAALFAAFEVSVASGALRVWVIPFIELGDNRVLHAPAVVRCDFAEALRKSAAFALAVEIGQVVGEHRTFVVVGMEEEIYVKKKGLQNRLFMNRFQGL